MNWNSSLPCELISTDVPDPFIGKSFGYEVKDGKAVVRGTPPADKLKEPIYNRVYEISIRK